MLLVYAATPTPRVKYVFNFVLKDILGLGITISNDRDYFINYKGAKLSYGKEPIQDELFIWAGHLLFEKGIVEQNPGVFDWNGNKAFFAAPSGNHFPFDPFAASFYLVSRYEEYLPHIRDAHERFLPKESLAFQNDFLRIPLVNIWANQIKDFLIKHFPMLVFSARRFEYISTLDIDNAYAFLEKGFMRSVGAYIQDLLKLNFRAIKARSLVLLGLKHDPYDTYQYQLDLNLKYNFKSIYFFLVGEYGLHDKNISINSRKFQSLIKFIADYAQVGIHPSYGSNKHPSKNKTEINKLSKVLKRDVFQSRQHYLKLYLPLTYRRLIDMDIKEDYTMGYASEIGFRASTCTPFNFYDLDTETSTDLKVFPFVVMDTSLMQYMKLKPEQALENIKMLLEAVKKVNGTFISLWHNESLCEEGPWFGWKFVYQNMIEEALKQNS
jgi:hypothetical protein